MPGYPLGVEYAAFQHDERPWPPAGPFHRAGHHAWGRGTHPSRTSRSAGNLLKGLDQAPSGASRRRSDLVNGLDKFLPQARLRHHQLAPVAQGRSTSARNRRASAPCSTRSRFAQSCLLATPPGRVRAVAVRERLERAAGTPTAQETSRNLKKRRLLPDLDSALSGLFTHPGGPRGCSIPRRSA